MGRRPARCPRGGREGCQKGGFKAAFEAEVVHEIEALIAPGAVDRHKARGGAQRHGRARDAAASNPLVGFGRNLPTERRKRPSIQPSLYRVRSIYSQTSSFVCSARWLTAL
jgi:hypothetical protein